MKTRVVTLAWLLGVWLALQWAPTPARVAAGVAVVTALVVVFRPRAATPGGGGFRLLHSVRFLVYFGVELIKANLQVAAAVIRPDPRRVRPAIVAVPVPSISEAVLTILANTISLTPGTSVVDLRLRPPVLYVHVLRLTTVEEVHLDVLERQRLLVKAIGSRQALEAVESRLEELRGGPRRRKGNP